MGVFRVNRGKAVYLYVKNRHTSKYIRVTDRYGYKVENYNELLQEAYSLDGRSRAGSGTHYLYLVCSKNSTYGYEQLVFRVQIPDTPSKTFSLKKFGYYGAFKKAAEYVESLGYKCAGVPSPARYKDLIVRTHSDFEYRRIIKEFKHRDKINEHKAETTAS